MNEQDDRDRQASPLNMQPAASGAYMRAIARTILAANEHMRASNVVIEVDHANLTVKIDAHAVPGITQGGLFAVTGERADGMLSEAHAYVEIAGAVTFDEAMAFIVNGYLDDFIELPESVRDAINSGFWPALNPEIAAIEQDSIVGEAVVRLLNDVENVCTRVYAEDGGAVEPDIVQSLKALAYRQCRVWYFG
jgi:hypothetical protein